MRVYLDNCCFNRPFDDQAPVRIRLETEAKMQIQQAIKDGRLLLVWSYILDYENALNLDEDRRDEIQQWEDLSCDCAVETPEILQKMNAAVENGLKPADGLHVACAMAMGCDYFFTVDKGILNKADKFPEVLIQNPVDFVLEKEGELC